jgi:ABC-2 type transport system ATP-binding protein
VAGSDPAVSKTARSKIGYLPEEPPLYNDDSVLRYVTYMASLAGIPRRDREAGARRALEKAAAADLSARLIAKLSKGQRQRVALAAAIVHRPDVVLLDEPTSGLDPLQRVEFRKLLRHLAKSSAILFSSHILAEAQAVCDRVIIVDHGSVVARRAVNDQATTRLRVRVAGADPHTVQLALRDVPGVRGVSGETYEVDRPTTGHALAAAVIELGWTLLELTAAPDDLETTFLRVVAGASQ